MIAALTGMIAGAVHVWSGPDHLAAVAPLAVRQPRRAWLPGIRWGLGHSAGVALIGFLSLCLRDLLPMAWISTWGERLVGVMLFGIGLWALRRALQHSVHTHEHEHDGERHVHFHTHSHGTAHAHGENRPHQHTHAAFGIGTLHGLAGSSHFFAILPSIALPTTAQAVAYLVAYGVGTVISMATFSWLLGWATTKFALGSVKAYRGMLGFSAAAAMGVGCFWLATSWQ